MVYFHRNYIKQNLLEFKLYKLFYMGTLQMRLILYPEKKSQLNHESKFQKYGYIKCKNK